MFNNRNKKTKISIWELRDRYALSCIKPRINVTSLGLDVTLIPFFTWWHTCSSSSCMPWFEEENRVEVRMRLYWTTTSEGHSLLCFQIHRAQETSLVYSRQRKSLLWLVTSGSYHYEWGAVMEQMELANLSWEGSQLMWMLSPLPLAINQWRFLPGLLVLIQYRGSGNKPIGWYNHIKLLYMKLLYGFAWFSYLLMWFWVAYRNRKI